MVLMVMSLIQQRGSDLGFGSAPTASELGSDDDDDDDDDDNGGDDDERGERGDSANGGGGHPANTSNSSVSKEVGGTTSPVAERRRSRAQAERDAIPPGEGDGCGETTRAIPAQPGAVGRLLIEFFKCYGAEFDTTTFGISVRNGGTLFLKVQNFVRRRSACGNGVGLRGALLNGNLNSHPPPSPPPHSFTLPCPICFPKGGSVRSKRGQGGRVSFAAVVWHMRRGSVWRPRRGPRLL